MLRLIIKCCLLLFICNSCGNQETSNFVRYLNEVHHIKVQKQRYYVLNFEAPCDCIYQHLIMLASIEVINDDVTLIFIGKNQVLNRDTLINKILEHSPNIIMDEHSAGLKYGIANIKPLFLDFEGLFPSSKSIKDIEIDYMPGLIGSP